MKHLDAYTAPRLVEYFDPDPVRGARRRLMEIDRPQPGGARRARRQDAAPRASA